MKIITIILDQEDDAMPPVVHRQGVSPREASMACYEAHIALWDELPGMTVETAPDLDGLPPEPDSR